MWLLLVWLLLVGRVGKERGEHCAVEPLARLCNWLIVCVALLGRHMAPSARGHAPCVVPTIQCGLLGMP